MEITNDVLTALVAAGTDRKAEVLRVLRGEAMTAGNGNRVAPEPFQTLREIARSTGVSTVSLWRWRIPSHTLGGQRRYRLSEVLEYLEGTEFRALADGLKTARKEMRTTRTGKVTRHGNEGGKNGSPSIR